MPRPFCPILQTVCSALWGLCGGHLSHRAGDARGGRCVPPALLHLQRMFLPPADRRPLCLQGGTVTVCQRGLPSVSGQPHFLVHRYKLFTACLFLRVLAVSAKVNHSYKKYAPFLFFSLTERFACSFHSHLSHQVTVMMRTRRRRRRRRNLLRRQTERRGLQSRTASVLKGHAPF